MNQYPVNLDLRGRKVLVVGGGRVACRKAKDALEAGAEITVVSPTVDAEMAALRDAGALRQVSRSFEAADLAGCFLAIAATDDSAVNAEVSRAALREDILVNVVDDAALSNFTVPAKLRRGALLLTASTGGASPSLSREIRKKLEGIFGEEYAAYLEFMARLRPTIIETTDDPRAREAIFGALADFGLIDLFAKDRSRFLESLRDWLPAGLMKRAEGILLSDDDRTTSSKRRVVGKVYLVGAGPGDAGLITVKGLAALRTADVILYDHLVNEALLEEARPDAELIYVGKRSGDHRYRQSEINRLLKERCSAGRIVVRLKGGDPFVFGRGGEEALALAESGLAFEVVPGVSSALAVPAYAGIPLTQRGFSSSVAFITGHEEPDKTEEAVDWGGLAASVDTLVILMGLSRLGNIVERLLAAGKDEATPVAVISRGTMSAQVTVAGTLGDIVGRVGELRLEPPAIIVVGEVVGFSGKLSWFEGEARGEGRTGKPPAARGSGLSAYEEP